MRMTTRRGVGRLTSASSSARCAQNAGSEKESRIRGTGLDRAPPDRSVAQVCDETTRRCVLLFAAGLGAEPRGEYLRADRYPGLPGLHLVALTEALGGIAARAEDRAQRLPVGRVRRNNRDIVALRGRRAARLPRTHGLREARRRRADGAGQPLPSRMKVCFL